MSTAALINSTMRIAPHQPLSRPSSAVQSAVANASVRPSEPPVRTDAGKTLSKDSAQQGAGGAGVQGSSRPVMANVPKGLPPVLAEYFAKPAANEQVRVMGFEQIPYGSTPPVPEVLSVDGIDNLAIVGALKMPPEVTKFAEAGIANMFSPEWQQMVAAAAQMNGGMGNSEQGFLAFSREHGFVRLRHPGLTPEQNRVLAAMSLQTGWPIERLPCRNGLDCPPGGDPKMDKWVNEFVAKYEKEIGAFVESKGQDPVEVKDGSRNRYKLEMNAEAGRVVSYEYRKAGGFKGWAQKNMSWLGPVMDVASMVATAFGAPYVAAGIQTAKVGAQTAAIGKFSGATVAGLAGAVLPVSGLSAVQAGMAGAAVNAGAQLADTGKISASALAGFVTPMIPGLTGDSTIDQVISGGVKTLAKYADGGKLSLADFWRIASPALLGGRVPGDGSPEAIQQALANGVITPGAFGGVLSEYIGGVVDDPQDLQLLQNGLDMLIGVLNDGRLTPQDALAILTPVFQSYRREFANV